MDCRSLEPQHSGPRRIDPRSHICWCVASRVLQELSSCELNYDQTAKAVEDYDGINIEMDHHQSLVSASLEHSFILFSRRHYAHASPRSERLIHP